MPVENSVPLANEGGDIVVGEAITEGQRHEAVPLVRSIDVVATLS